jgi:hypothetical protein
MNAAPHKSNNRGARPFLGIHFECCNIYTRIYKNKEGTAYVGSCPKCGKPVRALVGKHGTDARFFKAE